MSWNPKPEKPCRTGRCAYGEPCRCEFYAGWTITPPCPTPRLIRSGGYATGYRDGWKLGYAKGLASARDQGEQDVA